ncbi:MAG TPA: TadE family protein [Candidatus Sulfotelmatobacter sp.]|nr:TadE family protein [Candidatus Sulfotelmatobacter sp.]
MRKLKHMKGSSGQALIETALVLPILLTIALNAVNFAYFFLMALNITSASRSATIYSVMGGSTPASIPYPKAGPSTTPTSVSYLAYQDLTGAVFSPTTGAGVQVCSSSVGILSPGTTAMKTNCASFGSVGSFTGSEVDPELNAGNTAPAFLLNKVDVAYQFSPPIPLTPFNIIVLAAPVCGRAGGTVTCTFYRHVEMREM